MAKKVNYTDEMVQQMTDFYNEAKTDDGRKTAVEDLAEMLGRSVPSIRTKLSQLKVYIKPKSAESKTANSVSKTALVAEIEPLIGLEPGSGKSLKFATKKVLEAILETVVTDEQVSAEVDSGDVAQEATED